MMSIVYLLFEDLRQEVDEEVVSLVPVRPQQDARLLEVFSFQRILWRLGEELAVEDGREGAAHHPHDDPVPLFIHQVRGVGVHQAVQHVRELALKK